MVVAYHLKFWRLCPLAATCSISLTLPTLSSPICMEFPPYFILCWGPNSGPHTCEVKQALIHLNQTSFINR